MFELNIDIIIKCHICGEPLDIVTTDTRYGDNIIVVEPCWYCIDNAEKASHKDGYDEGYDDGYERGREEGYEDGYGEGYSSSEVESESSSSSSYMIGD